MNWKHFWGLSVMVSSISCLPTCPVSGSWGKEHTVLEPVSACTAEEGSYHSPHLSMDAGRLHPRRELASRGCERESQKESLCPLEATLEGCPFLFSLIGACSTNWPSGFRSALEKVWWDFRRGSSENMWGGTYYRTQLFHLQEMRLYLHPR